MDRDVAHSGLRRGGSVIPCRQDHILLTGTIAYPIPAWWKRGTKKPVSDRPDGFRWPDNPAAGGDEWCLFFVLKFALVFFVEACQFKQSVRILQDHFFALSFNQAIFLEAGKYPADGLYGQPEVITDIHA